MLLVAGKNSLPENRAINSGASSASPKTIGMAKKDEKAKSLV